MMVLAETLERCSRKIMLSSKIYLLTHFSPISHFYTPRKLQKTYGFLTFAEGIKM